VGVVDEVAETAIQGRRFGRGWKYDILMGDPFAALGLPLTTVRSQRKRSLA
jgi:hypothetical protein